jgi:hypothetical protein
MAFQQRMPPTDRLMVDGDLTVTAPADPIGPALEHKPAGRPLRLIDAEQSLTRKGELLPELLQRPHQPVGTGDLHHVSGLCWPFIRSTRKQRTARLMATSARLNTGK